MPNMVRTLRGDRAVADQVIAEVEDSLWLAEHDRAVAAKALREAASDQRIVGTEAQGWLYFIAEEVENGDEQ